MNEMRDTTSERDALLAAAREAYELLEVGGADCVARARRVLRGALVRVRESAT